MNNKKNDSNDTENEKLKKILSKLNYEQLEDLLLNQAKKNIDLKKAILNKEDEKC